MNVGISILATSGQNIWNSGINQNLAFLVMLLRSSPLVDQVWLLNGGDSNELPHGMADAIPDTALVAPRDVTHAIDVVIEMGAQLPLEWIKHVRALGAKYVLFQAGHTYATAGEGPVFDRAGGLTITGAPWDEIWLLPQHIHANRALMLTLARAPVYELPHIWSPVYLDRQIQHNAAAGHQFGFVPPAAHEPRRGWRTAIFEPNISVVKNCTIPMLVCEHAYRQERGSVDLMMVLNSFHMKEHPTFNALARHLDLTRDSRASYEPRIGFADCMAGSRMDAVVAHQWECGLNYAYYDALYGGYPLVHNSSFLKDAGMGFYYPGFAARAGGDALLQAWRQPPEFWDGYRRGAAAYLHQLLPEHPDNIQAFGRRLQSATERRQ